MPAAMPPRVGPSSMPLSRHTALAKCTLEPSSGNRNRVTTYTIAASSPTNTISKILESLVFISLISCLDTLLWERSTVYYQSGLVKSARIGEKYKTR